MQPAAISTAMNQGRGAAGVQPAGLPNSPCLAVATDDANAGWAVAADISIQDVQVQVDEHHGEATHWWFWKSDWCIGSA
jgi:hypothetical protein